MKISPEKLAAEAEATGFRPDVLKKNRSTVGSAGCLAESPIPQRKAGTQGRHGLFLSFCGYKLTVAMQQLHETAKARIPDATGLLTKEF